MQSIWFAGEIFSTHVHNTPPAWSPSDGRLLTERTGLVKSESVALRKNGPNIPKTLIVLKNLFHIEFTFHKMPFYR